MDIIHLYQDFNVPFATEGHKHCRDGWVNTACPFCSGNVGMHLGYDMQKDFFVCWRCGWKPTNKAIAALLHISETEAKEIIRQYGGKSYHKKAIPIKMGIKPFKFPPSSGELSRNHIRYLIKRKFDPELITKQWGIMGTGPVSIMDNISYSHRIVIPIYWQGIPVSFQTRDITGKHALRYITCPEIREKIQHKTIFYYSGDIRDSETECICVEGATDAWRFGDRTIAVFGIKYTKHQVHAISQKFKRVFIVFDDDPQAIVQSKKLQAELLLRNVDAYSIKIKGDPGDMPQSEADDLKRELLGNGRKQA